MSKGRPLFVTLVRMLLSVTRRDVPMLTVRPVLTGPRRPLGPLLRTLGLRVLLDWRRTMTRFYVILVRGVITFRVNVRIKLMVVSCRRLV